MLEFDENERIDWFRVITSLERNGFPLMKIAKETGIPKGTIHGWKMETGRPSFERAVRLIALWCIVHEQPALSVPTINEYKPTEPIKNKSLMPLLLSYRYLKRKAKARNTVGK